jgi:hypothetical protein
MKFKGDTIVFYSNDIDGATSSWVYNKKDPSEGVKYIGVEDTEDFSSHFFKKCTIFFLGVCPSKELYLHLRKGNNNRVIIFNDDPACKEEYSRFLADPDLYFHTTQTCNQSMWKVYFSEEKPPEGITYINDALNGLNSLPDSNNVIAYLENKELNHETIKGFVDDMSNIVSQEKIVKEGKVVRELVDKMVSEIASNHYFTDIDGYTVPVVCCNKSLGARVARVILGDYPFSCAFYIEGGVQKVFLCSRKGGADVSKIAKTYGGHGMPRVASITIKRKEHFIL